MNDISQRLTTEEGIIYEIVDDIINTENQISEMTNSLIINDNSDSGQIQFNLKHKILKNISKLNSLNSELESQRNELKSLQKENEKQLKELESLINETQIKIKNITTGNSKEDLYRLSYEKIEELISKKKNEDDLNQTYYEFSNYNNELQNLQLSLNSFQMQYNQIQERLQLIKEELYSTEDNIINILSQKESIEELCNLLFNNSSNINKNIQTKNNNNNNMIFQGGFTRYNLTTLANQTELRFIELYHFELCQCDINKVSKDISEILITYINNNLSTTTIQTNTNNLLMYDDNNNSDMVNIHSTMLNNNNSTVLNLSSNVTKLPMKNPLLKNQIVSTLRTSLVNFINLKSQLITSYNVNNYLSNISNKIHALIPNNLITQTKICDLIKYMLKISYFDGIIKKEMQFMDKDYKNAKKFLIKQNDEINMQIQKLKTRIDDYMLKMNNIKQREKYLTQSKAKNNIYLSPEEREYITLNEKLNELNNNKVQYMKDIKQKEEQLKNNIITIQNQINELTNKNKTNELKLEQLNQEMNYRKGNVNDKILSLRKEIAEKFKLIKMQLLIFKQKHGNNNMDLYNKLTERINQTLKSTSKTLLNLNYTSSNNITPFSTIDYSFNRNYRNVLLNNSITFNDNESSIFYNNNMLAPGIVNIKAKKHHHHNDGKTHHKGSNSFNSKNNNNSRQHHISISSGPTKSNSNKNNTAILSQSVSMSKLNNNSQNYNFINVFENHNKSNSNIFQNNNDTQKIQLLHGNHNNNNNNTNYFHRTFRQTNSQPIVLKSRNFDNIGNNKYKVKEYSQEKGSNLNFDSTNKSSNSHRSQMSTNLNKTNNGNKSRSPNLLYHSNSCNTILYQQHDSPNTVINNNNIKDIKYTNNLSNNTFSNYKKLFGRNRNKC